MSSIGNVEKNHQVRTENARRRADREIKEIENLHQKTKAELKKGQEIELQEKRESNRLQVTQENERKEKILQEIKAHLQRTKELTDKELKSIDTENVKNKQKIKDKFLLDRDQTIASHEALLDDLNERLNQKAKNIRHDSQEKVEAIKTAMSDEISDMEKKHRNRIDTDLETSGQEYRRIENNQKKILDQQNLQFKNERMTTNLNQTRQLSKLVKNHSEQLETRNREFRKGLKEQDLFFEKKFTDQIGRHEGSFKELEKENKRIIEKLKDSLTKEIAISTNRSEDPFYKFEKLNPKLKHLEDGVEIEVKVPEYSKQDLQLSINGKEAVVSFNRRYHDASKSEEGTINKINKVESFTSRVMTEYHLDPKSLKSRYHDGTMTFTIKKA